MLTLHASHHTLHISSYQQDNTIDFLEFVAALNLVFRGDLEHKLRWSFKVYDKDSNGYVDRSELRSIIDVSSSKCWHIEGERGMVQLSEK